MARADSAESAERLRRWLCRREAAFDAVARDPVRDVTVLIYFFRRDEDVSYCFHYSAQALRETWLNCGRMRTVIVTNRLSDPIERFASENGNVTVQVESSLRPGDIDAMSVDCNSKLYERFDTGYVLVVQDDGFPLRPGLDRFVGRYDFVGAPYRRRGILGVVAGLIGRSWPMNGGFSLRSRKFCEEVAKYWRRYYANRPYVPMVCADDIFCTKTLPGRFPLFFRSMRWPSSRRAADFSYEAVLPMNETRSPFGFHGADAFCDLLDRGRIDS